MRKELYALVLVVAGCGGLVLGAAMVREVTGWSVGAYVEAGPLGARVVVETPCYKSRFDPDWTSPGTKTTYIDGSVFWGYDGEYKWVDWGEGTVGCYLPKG